MSILTSLSCDQLRQYLADALGALHALQTGRQVAEVVDQNGERVKFTPSNQARLVLYIEQLQQIMASKGCDGASCNGFSGPLEFTF